MWIRFLMHAQNRLSLSKANFYIYYKVEFASTEVLNIFRFRARIFHFSCMESLVIHNTGFRGKKTTAIHYQYAYVTCPKSHMSSKPVEQYFVTNMASQNTNILLALPMFFPKILLLELFILFAGHVGVLSMTCKGGVNVIYSCRTQSKSMLAHRYHCMWLYI